MDETLVVSPSSGGRDLVVQAKERIQQIQQIMRAVMKPNVHFGVIPGTQDPSLYRAGAEVLAVTFRLALAPEVADLSGPGVIRYRIRHLVTDTAGHVIAVGVGECSSDEEKFAWRAAICAW